jgi:hypothetical protein
MGTKMKYAMMLYGDNAAGILVDDTGDAEADIERQMIQQALEGKTYESLGEFDLQGRPGGNRLFTTDEQHPAMDVTDSPTHRGPSALGSPTAVSPRMPDVEPPALTWEKAQNLMALKKVRAKQAVPEAQISMF